MSGFKLIAIIPLKDCSRQFLKNLKIGEVYKFYKNYTVELNKNKSKIVKLEKTESLFNIYNDNGKNKLSISAIVGKNGSGKSSIIELFFLFVYKMGIDKVFKSENLLLPKSTKLHSTIYELKMAKEIFVRYIETSKDNMIIFLEQNGYSSIDMYITELITKYKIDIRSFRFKSKQDLDNIILDALNKKHQNLKELLVLENGFDIAINMYLNVAVIYEKEENLYELSIQDGVFKFKNWTKNSIYLTDIDNIEFSDFFYTIAVNYSHHSHNSRISGGWLDGIFHKNDGYKMPLVVNPMREAGNFDINKEESFAKSRLLSNLMSAKIKEEDITSFFLNDSQKVTLLKFTLKTKERDEVKLSFSAYEEVAQFEKIIINTFVIQGLNISFEKLKNINFSREILNYIVNKFFKMTETYDGYNQLVVPQTAESIPEYVSKIYSIFQKDNSHVVYKLKQALNYLKFNVFDDQNCLWKSDDSGIIFSLDELIKWSKLSSDSDFYTVIEHLPPSIFEIDFIFNEKQKEKIESSAKFNDLSSGEKQLIHSVQTVVYHLNNLDSIDHSDLDKISYSNVNILFDEIELYFHPDLQRKFINYMIKNVNRLGLSNIEHINICFATHSPFILSDIISQNILRLENGFEKKIKIENETFGANIYQMLSNDFFMEDGFIGEFAKYYVEKLLGELYSLKEGKEGITIEKFILYEKQIQQIGERIIRIRLLDILGKLPIKK